MGQRTNVLTFLVVKYDIPPMKSGTWEIITRTPLATAGGYEPRFHLFPDFVPTLISAKLWPMSDKSYIVILSLSSL